MQNSASVVPIVPVPLAPTVACLLNSIQPPGSTLYPLDPSAMSMHKTAHVTVVNVLLSESYARAMPPHRPVDPTPHRSPISLPIDPAHPLNAAKPTPDISEQSTRDRDQFKVARVPSYIHHAPSRPSATSMAHSLPVPHSIGPIFHSIVTSPRISPVNPHYCESDLRNIIQELISAVLPPPRIRTCSAPASRTIITPPPTNCIVNCSYLPSHHARKSDQGQATFDPYGAAAPQAPAASSPTTHATVYMIPAC